MIMLNEIINYLSTSTSFRGWMSFPDYGTSALYYTPCLEVALQGKRALTIMFFNFGFMFFTFYIAKKSLTLLLT